MANDYKEIHARTIELYERQARTWEEKRSRNFFEKKWIDKFLGALPSGGEVLDAGCGAGEPIAAYIIAQGFAVTGIDSSPTMLELCSGRHPTSSWRRMDMRNLALNSHFDGIVAWDSFFHLNQDEQRNVLRSFAEHIRSGGAMLLTVGPEEGEVIGSVGNEPVYHSSLSFAEYESILNECGFNEIDFVREDKECGMHTVLLAKHRK